MTLARMSRARAVQKIRLRLLVMPVDVGSTPMMSSSRSRNTLALEPVLG